MTEYEIILTPMPNDHIKCRICKELEDRGEQTHIRYDKKRRPRERVTVRYWCKYFNEFLGTFYTECRGFNP